MRNNNKLIVKKLALKSLKADKRRNLLIVITIVFTTILLSAFCFYLSAQDAELEERIRGQYQAVCAGISQELIDILSEMPEVKQWGISQTIASVRYQDTALSVLYEDENQIELAKRPSIEGRLPERETEIMVERPFLQYLNLPETIGQTMLLDLGDGVKREYTITGIMQSNNTSRSYMVFLSKAYVVTHSHGVPVFEFRFRFAGGDEKDMDSLKTQIKDFLLEQGVPEDKIFYSSNYFDMVGFQTSDNTMLYLVGLLLVIACGVVIYSLFYISVTGKLRVYGRLKVIGSTTKQLKSIVRRETMVLSLCSIPIGIILAGIIVFTWMPQYWVWENNLLSALGVAIVMLIAIAASTRTPIRLAGRVSAIEAVRATPYSDQKTRGVSARLYRRITPVSLAGLSFHRNIKKSAFTFVSLGLTAIMLMCVATYAVSFDVNSMAAKSLGDGGNYMLTLNVHIAEEQALLQDNPLNETLYQKLSSLEAVNNITRYNSSYIQVELPKKTSELAFTGLTKEQMDQYLSVDFMTAGIADYSVMTEQNGVIISDSENLLAQLFGYTPKIGDVLHCTALGGQDIELRVLGIAKGSIKTGVGGSLLCVTDETLEMIYPETNNFNTVWNIHTGSDSDALRMKIYEAANDGRIDITSRQDLADILQVSADTTIKAAFTLVAFLFVFALVNLVNTLMTNLLAKQQELSIFQSVGMSYRQMKLMLSTECFWYVGITLIVTIAVGGPAGMLICSAFNQIGILGTLTYHFPWLAVAIFTILLLIIQYCYSVAAISYLQNQPLLERIKTME